ncbi:uncharacterized protein E0L32_007285 [Thyridium curvatum]|uniref:Uncharacterized protein n=1 Tax=Thyridium curvatum TaxID=1093900 RepID=A0A507APV3_9PEZI|nr:uncharacterized protein E0L32_007285 [Thyridium curvatum]TPX11982.1 hypothetical protein E0L32_007285 [Thyridium curvatum]
MSLPHAQEQEIDPYAAMKGYIAGNDYALPYYSEFSKLHFEQKDMLRHMNCSFCSTPGRPPTLASLKLHLQSLAYAVSLLCPSSSKAELLVGGTSKRTRDSQADGDVNLDDQFDWLLDMSRPYETRDATHFSSLNSLVNNVESRHDAFGTKLHCPLREHVARAEDAQRKPYATHHNLLMHANACLERLDYEYGATGGLLSILPLDEQLDERDMKAARNTLVGQWLLHTQRLTNRMHELEISYANALDALHGEAVVPLQHLSAAGPEARAAGRTVAFPQDRWVLANAGDDVFDMLHARLDRAEKLSEHRARLARDAGAAGERLQAEPAGEGQEEHGDRDGAYERGIVYVDVSTRYYRLKGQGKTTMFVLPARGEHPAVEATRTLESKPTVVTVHAPESVGWVSDMEKRFSKHVEEGKVWHDKFNKLDRMMVDKVRENRRLLADLEECKDRCKEMEVELQRLKGTANPA